MITSHPDVIAAATKTLDTLAAQIAAAKLTEAQRACMAEAIARVRATWHIGYHYDSLADLATKLRGMVINEARYVAAERNISIAK